MSRIFKKVDDAQALDLTVRLGDCLPLDHDHQPFSVGDHVPLSRFRQCREGCTL